MSDFQDLDYYELLGVPRSATQDEIKRAYRREINKYHPDRFVSGTGDQQAYAQRRSQRLTEAYAALTDFRTRTAYNANLKSGKPTSAPRQPGQTPPHSRDYQAELYDQATDHLKAGRTLQAIGVLRQLQQINPFYRDSADMLAKAEMQANTQSQPAERKNRRAFLILGGLGGIALVGVTALALAQRVTPQPGQPVQNAAVGVAPTIEVTAIAAPTSAPIAAPTTAPVIQPTAVPTVAPTAVPTVAPTDLPTEVPTVAPTVEPTLAPTPAPTVAPVVEGRTLLADNFSRGGWADTAGRGWEVGYSGERYRIGVNPYIGAIWTYRTLRLANYGIAADVQVTQGEGGLLIAFADEDNYLAFIVNPGQTSYRLEQRRGDGIEVLVGGQSETIQPGARAINRIQARLIADKVQLLVNGQQVAEANTSNLPRGSRIGLVAISGAGPAEAYFDNFEVREIE